ncbi:hypothetical protein JOC36_001176 [Weissella uvarum]|uniref:hypothetical protein n=1 Tax=Weissella uvarum TaxID=1479233 RepID=UPI001960EF48|nr:hypothetical protein [Weissella uvarum]MBM7617614.1 hypothetical protein [Weissella uvarum]MCM0595964.1 hypothetical protein [Weissella uvarum]
MEYFVIQKLEDKKKQCDEELGAFLHSTNNILRLLGILISRSLMNSDNTSIILKAFLEEEVEDVDFDFPRMVDDDELVLYVETGSDSAGLTYMKFKDFYPILERKIHNRLKLPKNSYWYIPEENQAEILEELARVKTSFGLDD